MTFEDFYKELTADTLWLSTLEYVHKGKDVHQGIKEALLHLMADGDRFRNSDMADKKRLVNGWLSNKRVPRENVVKVKRDISHL